MIAVRWYEVYSFGDQNHGKSHGDHEYRIILQP